MILSLELPIKRSMKPPETDTTKTSFTWLSFIYIQNKMEQTP
jgi:hypothetical protein